jgi:signal transduction histidine kinase
MRGARFIFLMLVLLGSEADAQLKFLFNKSPLRSDQIQARFVMRDGIDISNSALIKLLPLEWQPLQSHSLPLKKTAQSLWVSIPVHRLPKNTAWLVVKDPHINELAVWIRKGDSIVTRFAKTGDHEPFRSRAVPANDFVFPFPVAQFDSCELIVAADKRHTKTLLPLCFYDAETYARAAQKTALINGLLLGFVLIILVYNSALYVLIRQKVFLWYSIYLFLILLYFLCDMGYLFEYVHPELPAVNDVLRVGILSGSIIPFLLFFNTMLELKIRQPLFHRINNSLLLFFAATWAFGLFAAATGNFSQQQFWLNVYSILSPLMIVLLSGESLHCMKKKIPFSTYTTLSLLSLVLMSVVFVGYEKSLLPEHIITENALYLGICMELFIMTMAIAARLNSFKKTSESLLLEKNTRQEDIMKTVSAYKEQEMQRFSNMLHDTVGAKLSAIRMNLDAIGASGKSESDAAEIDAVAREVSALADEVRSFSHELSPLLLQKNGLVNTIGQLIGSINRTGKISLQFESIGSLQRVSFAQEIMLYSILQELTQNIIRHSAASFGIVQLILEKEIIAIYVEDNGAGFDTDHTADGLGFIQIKKLVTFVNGRFNISTAPGKGCRITIEFNNTDHAERN